MSNDTFHLPKVENIATRYFMFAFTEYSSQCLYFVVVLAFQLHLLKSSFKCLKGMLHISNQHTSISRADRVCVSGSKNNTGQKENRRKTSSHIQTCKILEKVGKFDKYLPTIQEKIKEFQQASRRSILSSFRTGFIAWFHI